MTRNVRATALLAALSLAACGGRSGDLDLAVPSSVVEGATGRECRYVAEAGGLPGFDELVRIGTRGSVALWGRGAEAGDSVELSVRYDEEGRLAWVQSLGATMEADRVVEIERLLRSSIDEEGPEDWGVRVLFVDGDVAGVLPSVVCEPARTSWGQAMGGPVGTSREMAELYAALGTPLRVRVSLDEQGRVMDARLAYSSGSRLLDQHVIDMARMSQYEPKLHDGIGIPSTLSVTIRFRRRI